MMTRMTSLIMVVGEQIKCFPTALCKVYVNVAGRVAFSVICSYAYGKPSPCYKVPAIQTYSLMVHIMCIHLKLLGKF
jgi:hypothetical protein